MLPAGTAAEINLSSIEVPEIFGVLRSAGSLPDAEMLRVFNVGVGMLAVVAAGQRGRGVVGGVRRGRGVLPGGPHRGG